MRRKNKLRNKLKTMMRRDRNSQPSKITQLGLKIKKGKKC